ncbi:transport protein Trs120 or TRAPPC9 TRAPP II complex subunit-domain-containing protein [Lasiosphaeria miniovina]|uniref:Transport protein Trs120 or TRAPPC9 TRAPP II complex subunit-domain-containing protein n=1 Tax=Lasiosphaeria miniovina TaxID=1954250 RepID=A0AA40E7J3_9PEZI|nr:transport protein Trs120 or TRAPPC9 TRAPP II complex subunit-domain-containing protein [Lasiosphaeria miniovina]KAK0727972.1 transport protein Trs120 or TRAPPC9 TRAPP II complex subunit-domain-containing protein [Lasiosphaeria miniovina]
MAERKGSEAGPTAAAANAKHSHAIPAASFPTHNSPRTWFLTSSLSPLCIRLIRLLLGHGDYVVACLPPQELENDERSAEFRELVNECKSNRKDREGWKDRIRGIRCDGRVMGACGAAVAEAVQVFGRIDILLCCKYEAVVGTVEELAATPATRNLVRDQFETIFFSQVNFIKAALPQFRAQHTGHIMVLTSIGGHIGTPGMSVYTAATWALEGFCDSLAYEIAPFNIKVTIVQPNKEIQSLTNKIIFAPQLPAAYYADYDGGSGSGGGGDSGSIHNSGGPLPPTAPSIRDIMSNVLNANPDTAVEPSEDEIQHRYPHLPAATLDRLVLETVHALTAIGGHENPPARHIVGFEGSIAVREKLKTVTEEMEDFVEASLAVDIFESELKDEAREGRAAMAMAMMIDAHMTGTGVRALVVPIGQIKRDRFAVFVDRLNVENIVHLRDVTPDGRPNRNMFSPLAFPGGAMFYELMTYHPPPSHIALSPFDRYRKPLVLIAVADGRHSGGRTELEDLRDHYSQILVHQPVPIPEGLVTIPPAEKHLRTTMKTVMCDVSALLLAEMTTLAKSYEGRSYLDSPGTALGRRNSQYSLPIQARMSMPPVPFKGGSPLASSSSTPGRPSTPVGSRSGLANPPTSFDDFPAGGDSVPTRHRTQSQDRVARMRTKTKCRIQVVVGSLYLQAGLWNVAIRELSEAATALELALISLLLLGWAGIEFQVPTIMLPPPEKGTALAAAIQDAESRDPQQPRWLRNLQIYIPELLDRILNLYTRATIRSCRMLAALHIAEGQLGAESLDMIVFGKIPQIPLTTSPRFTIVPVRTQILLTTVDRIVILSGIASAMVVRELISVLVGGLVEARTRGAADVGIHPAAGLVGLNGLNGQANGANGAAASLEIGADDVEQGIEAFLGLVLKTYGVVADNLGTATATGEVKDDSDATILSIIHKQSTARLFGMHQVKLNILRSCINFSEALPDFAGVLKYSSDLLRTAGSGIAPGPRREDAYPTISRDEQIRLASNISKTSNLSKRLGMGHLAAEYWDEFLVRGVKLEPLPVTRTPIPHAKSVLPEVSTARTSQDVNPFIYNPFLKKSDAVVERMLNPYEFEGADFESAVESTVIGAYRTQILRVTGVAKGAGPLRVTGAIIRVRGCRERRFPIFTEPWAPENEIKIKAIGVAALDRLTPQPVVVVKSCTLPQSSVMILEGERQVFSVTLENLSTTTPADFLLFSFQDSTQEPLQLALSSRDATPSELYEYELILAKKQALRLRKRGDSRRFIAPGETATFDFEILGKPGLTTGLIQIDYAHLGVPQDEVGETFYTRQVSLALTVTVNASVDVTRVDVLPLHGSDTSVEKPTMDTHCLLLVDLRNAWPSQVHVEIECDDGRLVLPVKRIYLEEPHAFIPALNPSRQRQFVFSTKITPDVERANREAFWYREKILDSLKGTWRATSGAARSGDIELRSIRLTSRMIEAVKVDEVGIDISMVDPEDDDDSSSGSSSGSNVVAVDEFMQVRVRITNRTDQPMYPTLRLMPALRHRPQNVALDFTRKFSWNGTLQQALPLLPARATAEVVTGVTALCRGAFEVAASVEETRLWTPTSDEEEEREIRKRASRPRSDTQTMMDAVLGARERRIWHSRRPCQFVVRDRR